MNAHIFFLQSRVCKKILYNKVLSYTKIAFLPLDKYLFVRYSASTFAYSKWRRIGIAASKRGQYLVELYIIPILGKLWRFAP